MAIARAFKIPVEIAYRAAGLLPQNSEFDETTAELLYAYNRIQSPQRRTIVMTFLKALVTEEENEQRGTLREKQ